MQHDVDAKLGLKGLAPKSTKNPEKTNPLHIGLPKNCTRPINLCTRLHCTCISSIFLVLQFRLLLCPLSFYLKGDHLQVRLPYCSLNTHTVTCKANINNKSSPWIQIPTQWPIGYNIVIHTQEQKKCWPR